MSKTYEQLIEELARKAYKDATGKLAPRRVEFKTLLDFEIGMFRMNHYPQTTITNEMRDNILDISDRLFDIMERENN